MLTQAFQERPRPPQLIQFSPQYTDADVKDQTEDNIELSLDPHRIKKKRVNVPHSSTLKNIPVSQGNQKRLSGLHYSTRPMDQQSFGNDQGFSTDYSPRKQVKIKMSQAKSGIIRKKSPHKV